MATTIESLGAAACTCVDVHGCEEVRLSATLTGGPATGRKLTVVLAKVYDQADGKISYGMTLSVAGVIGRGAGRTSTAAKDNAVAALRTAAGDGVPVSEQDAVDRTAVATG